MSDQPYAPRGMALYVRALKQSRHGTPKQFAKRCADHGLRWIALAGPWHDSKGQRWINKPATVKRYADALSAAEVKPHIWGYPWHSTIKLFVDHMAKCTNGSIVGWLLDPELGLKKHPKEAGDLFHRSRQDNPYRALGFSSYGLPAGHQSFPWEQFAEPDIFDPTEECDYGSPQLYDTPRNRILRGLTDYAELGFDVIIPSFGLYKWVKKDPQYGARLPSGKRNRKAVSMTTADFTAHMMNFVDTEVEIEAMIGWAENFATAALWRELAQWSERLDRGAFNLPA